MNTNKKLSSSLGDIIKSEKKKGPAKQAAKPVAAKKGAAQRGNTTKTGSGRAALRPTTQKTQIRATTRTNTKAAPKQTQPRRQQVIAAKKPVTRGRPVTGAPAPRQPRQPRQQQQQQQQQAAPRQPRQPRAAAAKTQKAAPRGGRAQATTTRARPVAKPSVKAVKQAARNTKAVQQQQQVKPADQIALLVNTIIERAPQVKKLTQALGSVARFGTVTVAQQKSTQQRRGAGRR